MRRYLRSISGVGTLAMAGLSGGHAYSDPGVPAEEIKIVPAGVAGTGATCRTRYNGVSVTRDYCIIVLNPRQRVSGTPLPETRAEASAREWRERNAATIESPVRADPVEIDGLRDHDFEDARGSGNSTDARPAGDRAPASDHQHGREYTTSREREEAMDREQDAGDRSRDDGRGGEAIGHYGERDRAAREEVEKEFE